jgi:hypothetical protein
MNRLSDRPRQLAAVLGQQWMSSADLRRLLAWRSRDNGELLTIPAYALALSRASARLIEEGTVEQKFERGAAGRPMRYLRRRPRP